MIVAGFGCRKGVSVAQVKAAFDVALLQAALDPGAVTRLAAPAHKRDEAALTAFAGAMALPLVFVTASELAATADHVLSASERVEEVLGVPSASEAAALAVAGPNARLLGPRVAVGAVTCALAQIDLDDRDDEGRGEPME
ncbi:cobalamin biosynthesis protein [Chelatococcus reniformis]|uniref:Cobalamin biosynthesis protein CbiG n=1 Tax=Chelatococcus reniformis TaxID=1494448 RepID=A0A916USE1_9HYPH|nr:cobalamin biosynthesis protein [Chelatococcus reniformis]GGC86045.1 cobalamin biosynthesis protein CbiG [Chelatococcus reniformis]